jgi:hypothetical protein
MGSGVGKAALKRGDYTAPVGLPSGHQEKRLSVYKLHFFSGGVVGAMHSGVVVNGEEWSFGSGVAGSGVFTCEPEQNEDFIFKHRLVMGVCEKPPSDIDAILIRKQAEWQSSSYSVLERNCNHFTSDLLMELVGKPAPAFVNSLAQRGVEMKLQRACRNALYRVYVCQLGSLSDSPLYVCPPLSMFALN